MFVGPCIMAMNLIIKMQSRLYFYQYWSVTMEKCNFELETCTDQKKGLPTRPLKALILNLRNKKMIALDNIIN